MGFSDFDPGAMSARLVLEVPAETADGQGGVVLSYAQVSHLWARIEPLRVALDERAGAETATITHHIWIRSRSGLFAGMRFRKGNRIFALKAFYDPDDSGRYLVCQCEEEGR